MPRYRLRTLMGVVAIAGLLLGLIGSVRVNIDRSGGGAVAMAVGIDLMSIVLAVASLAALLFLLRRKPPTPSPQDLVPQAPGGPIPPDPDQGATADGPP
jgi:hypothetical protein